MITQGNPGRIRWTVWMFLALLSGWIAAVGAMENTIVVNSSLDPLDAEILPDDGIVTLREAILLSENDLQPSRIVFDVALDGQEINLQRPLPDLRAGDLYINGGCSEMTPGCVFGFVRIVFNEPTSSVGTGDYILRVVSANNRFMQLMFGGTDKTGIVMATAAAANNFVARCWFGYDTGIIMNRVALAQTLAYGVIVGGGAHDNRIGLPGNTFAFCSQVGIFIAGRDSCANLIQGNSIGSALTSNNIGILIQGHSNLIGGDTDEEGNIITGCTSTGVVVAGTGAVFNRISHNSIYNNDALGIDLSFLSGSGDGPDTNSTLYPTTGPNFQIPAPELNSYTYSLLGANQHQFVLSGKAVPRSSVEIFEADPDPAGYGEGRQLVGVAAAGTDGAFSATLLSFPGRSLSLTGTDVYGNTSEFSQTVMLRARNQAVLQMRTWTNLFLLPVGLTRQLGLSIDRLASTGLGVTTAFSTPEVAALAGPAVIPTGRSYTELAVTGILPGTTRLVMQLGDNLGGALCTTAIGVDQATSVTLVPRTIRNDALDGVTPFRFYKLTAAAGAILSVSVKPSSNIGFDPVLYLFNAGPLNLSVKNNFQTTDCYLQYRLPAAGDYYLAVSDQYLRHSTDFGYHLEVWEESAGPAAVAVAFHEKPGIELGTGPSRMAQGDLDNDGVADLVVLLPEVPAIRMLLKKAGDNLTFTRSVNHALNFVPKAVAIRDFDRNGWRDILLTHADSHAVTILYNNGQLTADKTGLPPGPQFSPMTFQTAGTGAEGTTSDFNRDTYPDYALLDPGQALLEIMLNDGSGALATVQSLSVGTSPVALDAADFNGDTIPDLVVADGGGNRVVVLKGLGNGQFQIANTLTNFPTPSDVKSTDLDNDGKGDILICSAATGYLRTYRATSAFDFQVYQDLAGGQAPNSIAVADINTDGFEDVSVANTGSQDVYVYEGLKQGFLQPVAVITATGEVEELIWFSFGGSGSYFGVAPDENFVRVLQGNYRALDFPETDNTSQAAAAFAMANPSTADALVYMSLYGADGKLVDDPDLENPVAMTIAAGRQIAFFIADVFGEGVNAYQTWMRTVSLNPSIQGFSLIASAAPAAYLDGTAAQVSAWPDQILPTADHLAAGVDISYSIVNPSAESARIAVTCLGQAGQALQPPVQMQLPAGGRTSLRFSVLCPGITDVCYLRVTADHPVECSQYGGTMDWIAATTGIPVEDEGTTPAVLWAPHFAEGRLYRSIVDVFNAYSGPAQVVLRGYHDDGSPLAASAVHTVPSGGILRGDLSTLLGIDSQSADFIVGSLKVEADVPQVYGTITFGDRAGQVFASSEVLQKSGLNRLIFSHLAVGPVDVIDYFTGLCLFNPSAQAVAAHIAVYDEAGNLTAENDLSIPAGHKISQMLSDYVPHFQPQIKGYITVICNNPDDQLYGFELFGDSGLTFMSAVPAQVLP